jgi:agmatinase
MPDKTYDWLGDVPLQWNTFLDTSPQQSDPETAHVYVIPVPYDSTTSYKSGARDGPNAIIEASRQLEDLDLELMRDISTVGIHTTPALDPDVSGPEAMISRVRTAVHSAVYRGKLVAMLGGEHTITVGAVQAMADLHSDLSVLYLDAHADMRDSYMGSRWGHASVARRVCEVAPLVQVGVRSASVEEISFIEKEDIPVFFWSGATPDQDSQANQVTERLSSNVYISIDLDVFDPSEIAAVGTPEPGGMRWGEVIGLLRAVSQRRNIVGFDLVELSPSLGPIAGAYAAAKLAYKLMGYATAKGIAE